MRITKFLGSSWLMVILLTLYAMLLGVATFLKDGTVLYHSWWMFVLEGLLVLSFMFISIRKRLWRQKKWGVLVLHYGFAVVLCGAMTTHLFGFEGLVHIRQGQTTNQIIDSRGQRIGTLPFDVTLKEFTLERYSGSGSPSSYQSELIIKGEPQLAYMNNVVRVDGWRLYQSSYDPDQMGTVLTANQDVAGTAITYAGYLMLAVGFFLSFAHVNSRFRTLLRGLSVVALLLSVQASWSAVPDSVVQRFSELMVQTPQGRIEPVDTYTRELLRKIYRSTSYKGLNSNQVVLGMIIDPQYWSGQPIIKTSRQAVGSLLPNMSTDYVSFVDMMDMDGGYRLASQVEKIYAKAPAERTKNDKELLKLDEKANILNAIFNGQMLSLLPLEGDPYNHWYSGGDDLSNFSGPDSMFVSRIMPLYLSSIAKQDWPGAQKAAGMLQIYQDKKSTGLTISRTRIKTELLYNKVEPFKWSGFLYMGLGIVLVMLLIINMMGRAKVIIWPVVAAIGAVFLLQSAGMGIRWYISERAPWTNAYESLVFVGWAMALSGMLFARRSKMTFALATFFAGVVLFVSNLSWMDPQITPLVPVLKSYWLVIHVAVITSSYGFFGVSFLLGFTSLLLTAIGNRRLGAQIKELTTINELSLWIGLGLMTAGTFLGAIWANESWGRYWGWDPKETWALITMLAYAIILHLRVSRYWFNVLSVVGLGTVLMTYFGVNYYLTGLHSYGADSAPPALWAVWICYAVVVVVAVVAWFRKRKKQ